MKKITPILFGLCLALSVPAAGATKQVVHVRGDAQAVAAKFAGQKMAFEFTAPSSGEFKNPTPIKYGILNVPASIRSDRSEHNVDMGLIVSAKGEVVATAVVSSNSKALEESAREMAKNFRFRPAELDGKPVWSYVVLPVSYNYVDPAEMIKSLKKS